MSLSRPHTIVAAAAALVVVVITLLLNVIGLPIWVAFPIGLLFGAAVAWRLMSSADTALLTAWNATPLDLATQPTLENVIDGLCVTHGFAEPAVATIDVPSRNSAVIADRNGAPTIVITKGMLDAVGRMETEALMAHQLRISRDTAVDQATLGARLVNLAPTLGTRRMLREYVLGDVDVFSGDWAGVQITRYPPGLVSAYQTLLNGTTEVESVGSASAHLWLDDPGPSGPDVTTATHPAMQDRIAYLREL